MKRAVWTPLAELELEDILFYIRVADARPETARRVGREIRNRVDRQAARSESGHSTMLRRRIGATSSTSGGLSFTNLMPTASR